MINFTRKSTRMPEQEVALRRANFTESQIGYTEEMAICEAMRCLKCRKHPCMSRGCPVHNHIPAFIDSICQGRFEEAYQILSSTTCLPAVCGRVCPQEEQCEGNCVRGIKGQAVAIGALERFVADWHRAHVQASESQEIAPAGKRIAVIGSGPASLAAAGDLAALGYEVTVFDKASVIGGVLAYGIPEFRLPKAVVAHEVDKLKSRGVRFEMNRALGQDLTLDELQGTMGFDAVFLGFGAGVSKSMEIPGEDLKGCYDAQDFLNAINLDEKREFPKYGTIAIVGGGNVAMDACRSAVRTGADRVMIVYRRSESEMPAYEGEVKEARDEGVEFVFLTKPLKVLDDGKGNVAGLECLKTKLGEDDSRGHRKPVDIPGTEHTVKADCVIMAVGTGADTALLDACGLAHDAKGRLTVDPDTMETSRAGVYAGGDAVTGPMTVISAMGAGRRAAKAIHRSLS
ncbi:MAG: NADPH-dependent glutamate synthase [Succinivibrionaceae bacterium]|nr:NADPH-dependent glutamate synthase [Succinivibrionaceae bacterium]